MDADQISLLAALLLSLVSVVSSVTDPNDFAILDQFRKGLENPELLSWPPNSNDPCGPPSWKHVFCVGNRVTQIQVENVGLKGPLPENFNQLTKLYNLGLQRNQFNGKLPSFSGWSLPSQLQDSSQLTTLSLMNCNLVGPLPDFWGNMPSLTSLKLALNRISGALPASFSNLGLQYLWLNGQSGRGMNGPIDVVASMVSLTSLWLHGNTFSGKIPANIGDLTFLKDFNVNSNDLVGLLPDSLADMQLNKLDLNNNQFMGPVPKFKAVNYTYSSNNFCQSDVGVLCAPEVMALLEFLDAVNYPSKLVSSWTGNDPCGGHGWEWVVMPTTSGNNLSAPLPNFSSSVKLSLDNNPLLNSNESEPSPSPINNSPPSRGSQSPSRGSQSPPNNHPSTNPTGRSYESTQGETSKSSKLLVIVVPVASFAAVVLLVVPLLIYCCKKRKDAPYQTPTSLVIHPRDPSDSDNTVKIAVANNSNGSGSGSRNSSGIGESHVIEAGNLIISVQVLRKVTNNFAPENELGRGGFGVVYKGELDDGTKIAVKRMESGVINSKALDEFQSEIAVLSKVRHRHLVSLLGYSIEGKERLLVYEYMPQGALSKHLFHWKSLNLEPLSWKRRLNIALDVARGMEYLHSLAHQSFIHRDLKSSNILLGDDFRAKVSDFGLVKLALMGRVMGKITTKSDVFSFGVVLMELLTGLMALDEDRPEESQYLAAWFWKIKSSSEKLMNAVDPSLDTKKEETFESISIIAELAGHCTAREPSQRPNMGHAVNVLSPLVEKWKPVDDEKEEYCGIDYSLPLTQMVKGWKEAEEKDLSYVDLDNSKGSIPSRPTGFADSFTSADGR
ncbi:hypothetical protein C3L33_02451, partial [Rhododendron williamsianum]